MTDELCYTLYEPAIKLGVPRSKQYALIGAGDGPPTIQIGKTRMVTAEFVAKWMREQEQADEKPVQQVVAAYRRRPCH